MAKNKKSQQKQQKNNQETDTQSGDQMNTLQKSNEELESEITKKFEKEKKETEDQVMEEVKAELKNEILLGSYPTRVTSNPKQKLMAKKKQPQQQHECHHHAQEIEDPTEELLNGILLRKTLEYRLEINTLKKSKAELESEITKTQKLKTKNKELEGSLMEVKEANQLKKRMIKEKLNEIQQLKLKFDGVLQEKSELQDETNKLKISVDQLNRDLVRERDVVSEIEKKLDLQVNKSKNLKVQISDLEKNQVPIQKKLSEIEMENEKLVQDNKDGRKTLESVKSEKKAVEMKLAESLKAFDELKQDKERIVMQKENVEKNRNYQLAKIDDLEKHVQELVETIASLEKNDKMLRKKVDAMDKGCSDALQKQQQLQLEFALLERNDKMLRYKVAEENKERDEALQGLLCEKGLIEQKLLDLGKMYEELKQEKEEIAVEKIKIEKNWVDQSVEVALENVKWRKGYTEALEKQQLLEVELDSERKKMKEIVKEKDVIKMNMEKVKQLEKKGSLAVEMLIQEKSFLEKKLVEVEKGNQCLTSKMIAAQMNAEKALLMLKDAAQVMCQAEEQEASFESDVDMMKIEEDIQPFASELETIKKALKNKDKKMEEMTQQIEKLNKSSKRNSNIWALVSSATTFLAAAGATYIARGR